MNQIISIAAQQIFDSVPTIKTTSEEIKQECPQAVEVQWKSYISEETHLGQKELVHYIFEILELIDNQWIVKHEIRRRYKHFAWLQGELQLEFIGRIIPDIPQKSINYDKDKRKFEFVLFLQKVLHHPILRESQNFKEFIMQTDLTKFQKHVETSQSSRQASNVITSVVNTGAQALSWVVSKLWQAPVQVGARIPDIKDAELDRHYQNLLKTKSSYTILYHDIEMITQRFVQQSQALTPCENRFVVPEVQENPKLRTLQQVIKLYNQMQIRLKENCLYQLESFVRDYDQALSIITLNKTLKDQIYMDNQLITNPAYADKRIQLKENITTNTDKTNKLYQNFVDDISIFTKNQQRFIDEILKLVNAYLIEFQQNKESIKQIK